MIEEYLTNWVIRQIRSLFEEVVAQLTARSCVHNHTSATFIVNIYLLLFVYLLIREAREKETGKFQILRVLIRLNRTRQSPLYLKINICTHLSGLVYLNIKQAMPNRPTTGKKWLKLIDITVEARLKTDFVIY